ncbi:uncharacterized protein LOC102066185 isoform X1 [Zonotrichia albicollis]|uniref:uncharacterized protein LOC102066185 isoform X1 n=1 Tax=Zonotrichia albicollis TaxID=44394 RepID=UPI003D80EEA3
MTKAPFSVEWLSQSSQTLKSPTEGSPHRASSAGHGPGCGSSLGQGERSPEQPAGPRDGDGTGGRSRDSGAATPAAGTTGPPGLPGGGGGAGTPPGLPGKAPVRGGCSGRRGGGSPRGAQAGLTLCSSLSLCPGAGGTAAGGRPSGAVPEDGPECAGPEEPCGRGGRRLRTAFSAEQISTLESSFQRQQYLGAAERRQLAGRMRLSEVQIKTWFQNRRMKLKRQLQELRTEPFCSPALPYGPQGAVLPLPLTYVARPPPLPRQGAAPEGFPLAALPAPALDLSSACRAQPVGLWAAPCFVGYRDPRAFLLGV